MKQNEKDPTRPVAPPSALRGGSSLQKLLASGLLASVAIAGCDCDESPNPTPSVKPALSFEAPLDNASLTDADDLNSVLAGVQPRIALAVANLSTGSLRLTVSSGGATEGTVTLTVDGAGVYETTDLTLVVGDNVLSAELLNDAGTVVAESSVNVALSIVAGEPRIEITQPANGATIEDTNPDLAGVQGSVTTRYEDFAEGAQVVELWLNGEVVAQESVEGGDGNSSFTDVTFPAGDVSVEVRSLQSNGLVLDRVDVFVPNNSTECVITLDPAPAVGACDFTSDSTDLDPDEDGFQTNLTVSVAECDPERVIVTLNGEDIEAFGLDDGVLELPVTLSEGENSVSVSVTDTAGEQTVTPSSVYVVDTVAPEATIRGLVAGQTLTRLDDRDGDLSNGLDVFVEVEVEGVDVGTDVVLAVNGEEQTAQVNGESVAVFDVTFEEAGNVVLEASVADGCENAGTAFVSVGVDLSQSVLVIEDPENGRVYTETDDENPDDDGIQVTFSLSAVEIEEGEEIFVSCRRVGEIAFFERGTVTKPVEDAFDVSVSLPFGDLVCRAETASGVFSGEVEISVLSGEALIEITNPTDGELVNTSILDVDAFVVGADGERATLRAHGGTEEPEDSDIYDAIVTDGAALFESVSLDEGLNILMASLESGAESEVRVTLDTQGPALSFVEPSLVSSLILAENDSTGTLDDGIQIDVRVDVEDAHPGDEVCVTAEPGNTKCAVIDGNGEFTVEDVGLVPGLVRLTASATDAANNTSTADLEVTVAVDRARLSIEAPADGSALAEPTTDVVVDVAGLSEDVEVVLFINGVEGPRLAATAPSETLTFAGVTLRGGENTIRAELTDARGTSASPEIVVTVDLDAPEVAFTDPVDGALLNSDNADTSAQVGFQTNVVVSAQGVEDGQEGTLEVSCVDGITDMYTDDVEDGVLLFEDVNLVDQESCALSVSVSDLSGQEGSDEATVRIDRRAPVIELGTLEGGLVTTSDDIDPDTEGVQVSFDAGLTFAEDGDEVCIRVQDDPEVCVTLEGGAVSVPFEYSFAENGVYSIATRTSDSAGNQEVRELEVLVDAAEYQITFRSPANNAVLNRSNDTNADVDGLQTRVRVSGVAAMEGLVVHLCGNSAPADAEACPGGPGGFGILRSRSFVGAFATADFTNVSLAEGTQRLIAVSTVPEVGVIESQELVVSVDTQAPTVTSLVLTSDDASDGLLGPNEDERPTAQAFFGRFVASFEGVEPGQVATLRSTNATAANGRLGSAIVNASGEAVFTVPLLEGPHNVTVSVLDAARNVSQTSPTVSFVLDLTGPSVRFNNVQNGDRFSAADDLDGAVDGLQFGVRATSDAIGRTISLMRVVGAIDLPGGESDDVVLAEAEVDPTGLAVFDPSVTIPEGTSTLVLRAEDLAGNITTTSARVEVDSVVPTAEIVEPASGSSFDSEDPRFESQPGFQVEVRISGSEPGSTVRLTDNGVAVAPDAVLDADGAANVVVTLSGGTNSIVATTTDAFGNTSQADPVEYTVNLDGCGLRFVEPSGNPVLISEDDDNDPSNGVSTTWSAVTDDIGCIGRPVQLVVNGVQVAESPIGLLGSVEFTGVVFEDGSINTVLAEVTDFGGDTTSTDLTEVRVSLLAPEVSFAAPADADVMLGVRDDLVADPGFQTRFEVSTSNAIGGQIRLDSNVQPEPLVAERTINADTVTFENITLVEGEQVITATVRNIVGIEVTATVTVTVDTNRPDSVDFTATLLNRRTGRSDVVWTGVDATQYQILVADEPITDDNVEDLDVVSVLGSVPADAAPGEEQTFEVTELAWDPELRNVNSMYFVTVVAMDEAGNMSPVGTSESLEVGLLEARFTFTGGGDDFGFNTQGIGDVNNDGFDDALITNAPDGRAWVLYGRGGDNPMPEGNVTDLQELQTGANFAFYGVTASRVGDVNGDGVSDFAISAPFENFPTGVVYLFFGRDGAQVNTNADVRILGSSRGLYTGLDVAPAGNFADVAGEGIDDLVIGAPGEDATPGRSLVVLGRETWPATLTLTINEATNTSNGVIRIEGAEADFGYQAIGVADTNGDGFNELAVGSNNANSGEGSVYLFLGGEIRTLRPEDGVQLASDAENGGFFGRELAAGDVTGDGTIDLLVGSSVSDAVTVFTFDEGIPVAKTKTWASPRAGLFAEKMALVDLTGDGFLDVVVGGFEMDAMFVYFNSSESPFANAPDVDIFVEDTASWAEVVSALGDFNGDGLEDVIVSHRGEQEVVIFY